MKGDYGKCRSCRGSVRWAPSYSTGTPMPLDLDDAVGNVLIDATGRARVFRNHAIAEAAMDDGSIGIGSTYVSHHARCPQGPAWKGKHRGDPDEPPAQGVLL